MNKERLEYLKQMIEQDYSNRHDVPQLYFSIEDLKWLINQTEKVEKYEAYFKENSVEEIERKLEPYYEEITKLYYEED